MFFFFFFKTLTVPMLALTSKHRISLSNNNQTNPKKEKSLRYGLCLENKAAEEEEKE